MTISCVLVCKKLKIMTEYIPKQGLFRINNNILSDRTKVSGVTRVRFKNLVFELCFAAFYTVCGSTDLF